MTLEEILSGIGYAADTPGSLLRGALTGQLGERVSGRELLEQMGLVDQDSGFGGDAAGFAAGMATDPLTFLGGLGAMKGVGAYRNATGRLGQMADTGEELASLAGGAQKFDAAADAMRAGSIGHADDFVGQMQGVLGPNANPVMRPEVWDQLPNSLDLEQIARRGSLAGASKTDNLTGGGMKLLRNTTPELQQEVQAMGLGGMGKEGLEIIPNVAYGSKGAKAVSPPMVGMRGNQGFLKDPGVNPNVGQQVNVMADGFEGFPTLPYEDMLRQAGSATAGRENELMSLMRQLESDPTLMMDLIRQGTNSPLAMAILGGVGAGGAYAVGDQMFGG